MLKKPFLTKTFVEHSLANLSGLANSDFLAISIGRISPTPLYLIGKAKYSKFLKKKNNQSLNKRDQKRSEQFTPIPISFCLKPNNALDTRRRGMILIRYASSCVRLFFCVNWKKSQFSTRKVKFYQKPLYTTITSRMFLHFA